MTKDPWLFWRGGWKLRCESLGSLRYFLHGLVERVGDIVRVIKGADKSRNGEGATLPPNGVLALFLEDKMTKDPWLFWRGGWKLRCESLGSLRYFLHGLVERAGDIVQVIKGADKSRNGEGATLPPNGVFALLSEDKMTKDPLSQTQGQFWNSRSSQQWPWARAGPGLKHQKQPAVALSQTRASSETPQAASQWYVDCPEPPNHPKPLVVLQAGLA